ncbi:MAG: tetratricopeptide repeat protein, partial [Anaerolineae bacterium]|nr:tetratricopeptide repeat protein [Anaerolineae bacterium]
ELEQQLADCERTTPVDVHKQIDILNDLAWALSDTDLRRAYDLAKRAYELAASLPDSAFPYQAGIISSLRTQGYLDVRFGDFPAALEKQFKALAILESQQSETHLADVLPDVLDVITGILLQIGSHPEALSYGYRQLAAAEKTDDGKLIANAQNNLAAIFFRSGELAKAEKIWLRILANAREAGNPRIEAISHLNLAYYYHETDDVDKAREHSLCGLRVSRDNGYTHFSIYGLRNMGLVKMKRGKIRQAIGYFERSLSLSSTESGSDVTTSFVLLSLGEAYQKLGQSELAIDYLLQALRACQSAGTSAEEYRTHHLLSTIYEQQGDLARSLEHFKQFQAIKERSFNDDADRRLKVLQVVHDTETARKEAEIERLRAVELQRKNAEAAAMRRNLQRQLEYVQALSGCSQTLLENAKTEADQKQILNQALEHLRVGSRASRSYIYYSFQDPDLGDCLGIVAEACAP